MSTAEKFAVLAIAYSLIAISVALGSEFFLEIWQTNKHIELCIQQPTACQLNIHQAGES